MSLEAIRKEASANLGERAESNIRLEIRVDFAKDRLVPKVGRFVKELQESVKPIPTIIHKALSSDLSWFLKDFESVGVEPSKIMNLGGITIKNSSIVDKAADVAVLFGLEPECQKVHMYVEIGRAIAYPANLPESDRNIFDICKIISENKLPSLQLKNGEVSESDTYEYVRPNGKEVHVLENIFNWPLVSGDNFFEYINKAWSYIENPLFELCRS